MRKRFIIRLLLLLGVALGLYLTQRAPEGPAPENRGEAPTDRTLPGEHPSALPPSTPQAHAIEPEVAEAAQDHEAAGDLDLDPEQAAKLARLREALEALTARAREVQARRDRAVIAPAGETVPEAAEATPPHPVDREGIQAAIQEMKPKIRECYEAWLTANAEFTGKLTLSFRIEADPDDPTRGRIAEAKVQEGGLGNRFLDGCVVASLHDLSFEAPREGGVAVTYPFLFASNGAPPETP